MKHLYEGKTGLDKALLPPINIYLIAKKGQLKILQYNTHHYYLTDSQKEIIWIGIVELLCKL